MGFLQELKIKGIRSFRPDQTNSLAFNTPLTLILGANGSGKTTIIECLKYAITGNLPPNSRGGAFLFDPKITGDIDVKANVTLAYFSNNISYKVKRTLHCTNRRSKCEQKTLECGLHRLINDEYLLISNRLSDLDKFVPEHFSLIPGIIENVIFCHQEESTWPLAEPTILKKKLDDIFCSSKYVKALVDIKTTKKEITQLLTTCHSKSEYLYKEKVKRDNLIKLIQDSEELAIEKKTNFEAFNVEKNRLLEETNQLEPVLDAFNKIKTNHEYLKIEYKNLQNEIEEFNFDILTNDNLETDLKEVCIVISSQINRINEFNYTDLMTDYENERKKQDELYEKIQTRIVWDNQLQTVSDKLFNTKNSIKENISSLTGYLMNVDRNNLQQRVSDYISKLYQTNISINEFVTMLNSKFIQIKNESENIKNIALKYIKNNKDIKENTLIDITQTVVIDYQKLDDLYQASVLAFDKYQRLVMRSQKATELNGRYYEFNAQKKRIAELRKLIVDENHKELTNEILNEKSIEIHKKYKSIQNLKADLNSLIKQEQFELVKYRQLSERKEQLLIQLKEIAIQLNIDIENNVLELKKQPLLSLNNLTLELDKLIANKQFYDTSIKLYKDMLISTETNVECPWCYSHISTEEFSSVRQSHITTIESMEHSLSEIIKLQSQTQIDIENMDARNTEIIKTNQLIDKFMVLHSEFYSLEVPDIQQLSKKIKLMEYQQEQENIELEETKKSFSILEAHLNELSILDKKVLEFNMNQEVDDYVDEKLILSAKALSHSSKAEYNEYQEFIKNQEKLKAQIEENIRNRNIIKKMNICRAVLNELKGFNSEDINIQITQLIKRATNVQNTNAMTTAQIRSLNNEYQRLIQQKHQFENEAVEIKQKLKEQPSIETYEKCKIQFENLRIKLDAIKSEHLQLNNELNEKSRVKIIIEKNIKLRTNKERLAAIKHELSSYDEKHHFDLQNQKISINKKVDKITIAESVIKGELKQLYLGIERSKQEIKLYKDVIENYNSNLLEIKFNETSIADLDRTITVLDKAIVEYHQSKLIEVNACLRDLWINTYKGNEIDFIEIQSDVTATSYNYRIVMYKNGAEIDMRGRCSAGQKMIASLLIRMALAESFSDANILTLDEPTTNLDKANIEALAVTLGNVVREKKNIQLIVITHDEEFLSMLTCVGIESFYRLRKDSTVGSVIEKFGLC